jgi:hypothetical protein
MVNRPPPNETPGAGAPGVFVMELNPLLLQEDEL